METGRHGQSDLGQGLEEKMQIPDAGIGYGGRWKGLATSPCNLCPRACMVDRKHGQTGFCLADDQLYVARAALHMWEEPCISGEKGSGAIFFSGCNLRCVYCQNDEIAAGRRGRKISIRRLSKIMMELQEKGAANINLVTPDHYVTAVVEAVLRAREQGLHIPIVYNCSGYAKREVIRGLAGIVDVFLTDFKYMDAGLAARYSSAPDYPEIARAALEEMVDIIYRAGPGRAKMEEGKTASDCLVSKFAAQERAVDITYSTMPGDMHMEYTQTVEEDCASRKPLFDEDGMMQKGVIVRHLLLPGHKQNAKDVIRYVYETYGDMVYISLMNQYTPFDRLKEKPQYKQLCRRVTRREYESVVDYAIGLGVTNAFIQEGATAQESFIPEFDGEGI